MEENICKKIRDELKTQGIKPVDNQPIVYITDNGLEKFVVRYEFGTNDFVVERVNPQTSNSVIILKKNQLGEIDVVSSGKIEKPKLILVRRAKKSLAF